MGAWPAIIEQGRCPHERARAAVADCHGAAIRSGDITSDQSAHDQLNERGIAFPMRCRACRKLPEQGTRGKPIHDVGRQNPKGRAGERIDNRWVLILDHGCVEIRRRGPPVAAQSGYYVRGICLSLVLSRHARHDAVSAQWPEGQVS